jgi:hypothetical protein
VTEGKRQVAASNRRIWLHVYGKAQYPFDDATTLDDATDESPPAKPPCSSAQNVTARVDEAGKPGEEPEPRVWWRRVLAWMRKLLVFERRGQQEDRTRDEDQESQEAGGLRGHGESGDPDVGSSRVEGEGHSGGVLEDMPLLLLLAS